MALEILNSPSKESATVLATTIGNEMVGVYSAIPLTYKGPNGFFKVGLVVDVMTSIKARGKGIFTNLGFAATEHMEKQGMDILTGYPVRPEVLPGHKKVGWEFQEQMPVFVWPSLKLKALLLRFISFLLGLRFEVLEDAKTLSLRKDVEEFNASWEKEIARNKVSYVKQDHGFLNWRYSAPHLKYRAILAIDSKNKVQGIMTGREMNLRFIPSFAIADFRVLKVKAILALLAGVMWSNSIKTVLVAGMYSSTMANLLKIKRFLVVPIPQKFWLILKPSKLFQNKNALNNFYLSW